MKRAVWSTSARGITNTRSESGGFSDVFPEHQLIGNANRLLSIVELFEATREHLRARHWLTQNPFSYPADGPYFSLGEQLYTARLPASHGAYVFFFENHHVAIRKTTWILARFIGRNERGDLKKQILTED